MANHALRKYGVEATFDFELFEVDGVDLRVDWVPAAADCEVMKDGGASTQCTNTATDEGSTYSIVLTATEMQAARLVIKVVDAATKVFLDKVIIVETYGNASAQHAFDLDTASVAQTADNDTRLTTIQTTTDKFAFTVANQVDANTLSVGGTAQTANDIGADTNAILLDTAEIGTAGAGLTDLGGMSAGMKAEVNVEAKDVLFTDTDAEPAQGAPAATASLATKIGFIYKAWRNRSNQTATLYQLYNDDATTVDHKATVSDDATTAEKGEVATGP